jgi:hypothetical protein
MFRLVARGLAFPVWVPSTQTEEVKFELGADPPGYIPHPRHWQTLTVLVGIAE